MRELNFLLPVCFMMIASLPTATAQIVEAVPTYTAPLAATSATVVPMLVRYNGVAIRGNGIAASGASVTFLIYKDEKGGDPLWIETQSVATDVAGRYEVYLGSTYSAGLPPSLFGTGEARWLEVQIAGETTAPRTLLTSVPYALKAADAATLGGLPASAFALAGTAASTAIARSGITSDTASDVTTTGGTSFYLPKFNAASTVIDSEIYDTGTSVGIGNIPNPGAKLDVNGSMIMRGNMTVSRTGNATSSTGYPSYGFDFFSNVYNSSTKAGDNPYFQLQSEPTGNDTASPSATFNLLFANNGSKVAETGFSINPNGTINFASGQTFPGTGTITGITTTSPLTGSGTSGSVALALNTSALETTLNGAYAQLNATNTFSAGQIYNSAITAPGGAITSALVVDDDYPDPLESTYRLEMFGENASVAEMGVVSEGTDAAIAVNNAASGGREYWIDSGSKSAGIGEGNFAIYDNTAKETRMVVTSNGFVGINTGSPGAQLEVDAGQVPEGDSPADAINARGVYTVGSGSSNGITSYGGDTGGSSEVIGGFGGVFTGGSADTTADAGSGLFVTGGSGKTQNAETYAAYFDSDIVVNGNTVSDASTSKIDHPSDPANKYLNHASIQSSELMNLYTGNVTTDSSGHATVKLPDWFEAENADFRYQLTVLGQFAQAIVKNEIANGQFTIMTSAPNVRVSWQVTAVRQDAYAKAHPLVVEEAKPVHEVGFYKHPELYGQPANKQTEWGRNPHFMQRMEAQRTGVKAHKAQVAAPVPSRPLLPRVNNLRPTMQSSLIQPSNN